MLYIAKKMLFEISAAGLGIWELGRRIAPLYGFFRNCRLKERLFHLHFLIPATDKNHFPPPFGKWFLSLRL